MKIPCRPVRAKSWVGFAFGTLAAMMGSAGFAAESFAGRPGRLAFNAAGHRRSLEEAAPLFQARFAEIKEVAALRTTAEAGESQAQLDLALRYESGQGVTQNTAEAIKWFLKAAEQGLDEAQYALGCCYNSAEGAFKNPEEAARWWGKAAAQGFAAAQYCLGLSYSMGEGVSKNPAEAAKWWTKAAEQKHADAQYFLGLSYAVGLGVPKAQPQAIYWLKQAASNGNARASAELNKLGQRSETPRGNRSG